MDAPPPQRRGAADGRISARVPARVPAHVALRRGATEGRLPLSTVLREWGRIGLIGFGGPPAHIALLRHRIVEERGWISREDFEAAIVVCNLLPGPASTQLAILCAHRLAGRRGALVGGLAFIAPAILIVLGLSVLFLARTPPRWVRGAGEGAGAAIAAVAVSAGLSLLRPSWRRADAGGRERRARWVAYAAAGAVATALIGPELAFVVLGCGLVELAVVAGLGARARRASGNRLGAHGWPALVWLAFKVGALSYGGGFVIVPLMEHDAVNVDHWMTSTRFLDAVALGQISPGPVVATIAGVGYAARGIGGGLLASAVAFTPSFAIVLAGAGRLGALRHSPRAQAFLDGAGPAAIGAILGAAVPLTAALHEGWQFAVLAAAAVALLLARRGVVETLLGAGAVGVVVALAGGPLG